VALITLAGAALRARYLSQPMRYDEAFTYLAYASQPLAKGLARYDYPNNHLLHTLLVHVTTTVFGNHPWSLRLPAYTAGVALVPAWWWAVRGLYPGAAGLLTAGLVAGSSPLVEFSTNARGYMLVALDCALLVGASTALLRRATPPAVGRPGHADRAGSVDRPRGAVPGRGGRSLAGPGGTCPPTARWAPALPCRARGRAGRGRLSHRRAVPAGPARLGRGCGGREPVRRAAR
jgi:hypothetical protein